MYAIEVSSNFEGIDRYNFAICCAGYDAAGGQIYVEGCEGCTIECKAAQSIHVIVYAVTNTLPEDRLVVNSPPFDVEVIITKLGEVIYQQNHAVNQWGGATINIKM